LYYYYKTKYQYKILKAGDKAAEKRDALLTSLEGTDFKLLHKYDIGALIGFSGVVSPSLLQKLLSNDDIDYIEFDQEVSTQQVSF